MTTPSHPLGRLWLVPTPLDFGCDHLAPLQQVMPLHTLQLTASLRCWISENAKSTRAYLKRVGEEHPLPCALQEMRITELPREVHKKGDHLSDYDAKPLLAAALTGQDIGLVSEAGMPAIADPGSSVVRAAHQLGLQVCPLVGPVSLLLMLAASGLNGQNFAFVGYLPQDPALRQQRIRELEGLAVKSGQTQLFIETPYRNQALFQALLQTLKPSTRLAIGSGLTLPTGQVRNLSVQHWKQQPVGPNNHTPAVYGIGV